MMLKNIFRNRRRSKNEPFGDENEPVTYSGSRSKTFLPDSAVGVQDEQHDLFSHQDGARQKNVKPLQLHSTENILSATDVRYKHANAEYVNRAVSSSQVSGGVEKYNSGRPVDKRHRLSSVVNKILRTHSESKPAPRMRRVVASDLYTPGFWTKHQTDKNGGMQASGIRHDDDSDKDGDFAIPYSCQSCSSTALHGETDKNRFRSDDSWICSHCRRQVTKARDRHGSTVSSPPALVTLPVDSHGADDSDLLCQPQNKLSSGGSQVEVPMDSSHGKYTRNCSSRCDAGSSCVHCKEATRCIVRDKGKFYSVENVSDCDGLAFHRDASNLPSPLHVCDLECHESKLSSDDGDDDDAIPELVEIHSQSYISYRSPTGDAGHFNEHSLPVVQPTAETEWRNVNESEMYILTDSFLDYSSTSFVQSAALLDTSRPTTAGRHLPEVMVADDYEVMYLSEGNPDNRCNLDSPRQQDWLPIVSPHFTANPEKLYHQHDEKADTSPALCHSEEQIWCRKSVSDWSTDDVLCWVVSVGLVQFFDTFRSKLLQSYHV